MNFITKTSATIMPIVQHPFFKTGCYTLALIAIIILLFFFFRSIRKARKALQKKELVSESHPGTAFISIIFFMSLSFGILADITDWNKPGKITVLDNGRVISQPKVYLAMGAKPSAVYDRIIIYTPAKTSEEKEPVKLEFADYGSADANFKFKIAMPDDAEKIMEIHKIYGNQEKLLSAGVKPYIAEAMKIGARLLKADENVLDKEKKLLQLVEDQLAKGCYVMEDGKIKLDETGTKIRQRPHLVRYRIKLSDFQIENFRHEELLKNLIKEKDKIVEAIKGMEGFTISSIPAIDAIPQEIEKKIQASRDLTREQKKLIGISISSFKNILEKLKVKEEKSKKKEGKKGD